MVKALIVISLNNSNVTEGVRNSNSTETLFLRLTTKFSFPSPYLLFPFCRFLLWRPSCPDSPYFLGLNTQRIFLLFYFTQVDETI